MRTLIDLPEPDVRALDDLGRQRGVSRARLVREAVELYLAKNPASSAEDSFGLWRDRVEDGIDYQRRVRAEW